MKVGKKLWAIIGIKFFIFFVIMKFFFFSETLHTRFSSDEERASHIINKLTLQEE